MGCEVVLLVSLLRVPFNFQCNILHSIDFTSPEIHYFSKIFHFPKSLVNFHLGWRRRRGGALVTCYKCADQGTGREGGREGGRDGGGGREV